jgi:hypothetical protein
MVAQHAIRSQSGRSGEAVNNEPLRLQMRRNRGKDLATNPFDIARPQMMAEKTGHSGRIRGMAKRRRKRIPGKHGVGGQEGHRFVRARSHGSHSRIKSPIILALLRRTINRHRITDSTNLVCYYASKSQYNWRFGALSS